MNKSCTVWVLKCRQWAKRELVSVLAVILLFLICLEISLWKHHIMCDLDNVCSEASDQVNENCDDLNSMASMLFLLYNIQVGLQVTKTITNLQFSHLYMHIDEFENDATRAQLVRTCWNLIADLPIVLLLFLRIVLMPLKSMTYESELPKMPGNFIVVLMLMFFGCVAIIVDLAKLAIAIK